MLQLSTIQRDLVDGWQKGLPLDPEPFAQIADELGVSELTVLGTLKELARDKSLPMEERFEAQLKLSRLPRNSAPSRIRNRCQLTGRPRGVYRKFKMSRIALRELASTGQIPGMVKSSW